MIELPFVIVYSTGMQYLFCIFLLTRFHLHFQRLWFAFAVKVAVTWTFCR